MIREVEGE